MAETYRIWIAEDNPADVYLIEEALRRYEFSYTLKTADNGEVYFHRNSVVGGAFDKLAIGDEVRFVAQHSESAEGLQASTVSPVS